MQEKQKVTLYLPPELHRQLKAAVRQENPDLPTLEPWRNTIKPPSEYFLFERNPFYHRIDAQGHQLPYIDKIQMTLSEYPDVINLRAIAGEYE